VLAEDRQLSQYLARLSCTAEQVLITSGYSGSLRLILDTRQPQRQGGV
jgi:DNA-binding transcriptional MocR family regulator